MKIVLDTNVLVSAMLSPRGKPAEIVRRFFNGEFTLCCDDRIFSEYDEVLHRDKFHFDAQEVRAILDYIRFVGNYVEVPASAIAFADEEDRKFYDVAKFTGAILITGNLRHYPADPCIKSVNEI